MLRITPYKGVTSDGVTSDNVTSDDVTSDGVTRYDLARALAGKGRYWTTAYLVDGLLLDSGCAHTALEFVHSLGGRPLTHLFNTHTHEDHIGANGPLQRLHPDLRILAHPLALPVLAEPRRRQPLHPYRRLFWGWPEPSIAQAVSDGELIATHSHQFQVIYTPGHSPDHACLYEPQRGWLFTGDLFVGGRDRALRLGYDIWEIIASLKRVASLPLTRMFHGSARVPENPRAALLQKIAYLEELGGRVMDLHRHGWSVPAIVREVCGKTMWVEWITLGNFSRRRLVLAFLGKNQER